MLKTLSALLIIILLIEGCGETKSLIGDKPIHDWSMKISSPNEELITNIGSVLYHELYKKRAILYSRFGDWTILYVHGYTPMTRDAIMRFVRKRFGSNLAIEFGREMFPEAFASLSACAVERCHVLRQCTRAFEGSGENPSDVTGRLAHQAIIRGYPITGIFFEGTPKGYRIEVPFYADCEHADEMMARLRAAS